MEDTVNEDESYSGMKNNSKLANNAMIKKDCLKGLKCLLCYFQSKTLARSEEGDYIYPKYLKEKYKEFSLCLNDSFKYYGIELNVVSNYKSGIEEMQTGKY